MSRRPTTLAPQDDAQPSHVRALRTSEAALAAAEAQLALTRATVERQARDLAALELRKPTVRPAAPPVIQTPQPDAGELNAAREENRALQAELIALKASTSWRLTSPLRAVFGLLRR